MIDNQQTATFNTSDETRLFSLYPELAQVEKKCWFKLINQSLIYTAPPKTIMQTSPGPYDHLLLLIEGSTRAYHADDSGREITLYRNLPGDLCSANLQNLFQAPQSCHYIQAETSVYAIQLSARAFHQSLEESPVFRQFIFCHFARRFNEISLNLQDITFKQLDARLCQLLKKLFTQSAAGSLNITHQQLANELGTTREVISRSLKLLEKSGCLKITRGQLTMVSPEKLNRS
ncbi:MAG: Crp/Fnr family transcriptional regulator [Gammaproteobacteria bacterium]|nr:Crp/Fnr family transcriptional regulator [Gammaproteobacteria bacterium]